jgi:hypothetical protein
MSDQIVLPTHPRFNDLTGKTFGRLTVLRYLSAARQGHYWMCRCECGTPEKAVLGQSLVSGNTKSCGCLIPGRKPDGPNTVSSSRRNWKPAGILVRGRTTLGERLKMSPSYKELLRLRHAMLEHQSQLSFPKMRDKLLAMDIVPADIVPLVFVPLVFVPLVFEASEVSDEEKVRIRTEFEQGLGYFLQCDLVADLDQSELLNLVSMCVVWPPFRLDLLRTLLKRTRVRLEQYFSN